MDSLRFLLWGSKYFIFCCNCEVERLWTLQQGGRVTHDKSASKPTTRQDIGHHRYSHSRGPQTNSNITICVITITNHHYHYYVALLWCNNRPLTRLNGANQTSGKERREERQVKAQLMRNYCSTPSNINLSSTEVFDPSYGLQISARAEKSVFCC